MVGLISADGNYPSPHQAHRITHEVLVDEQHRIIISPLGGGGGGGGGGTDPGALQKVNNLSDLTNVATARTNLGLGTAAVQNVGFFLQTANNLSDVTPTTARTNLGLGTGDNPQFTALDIVQGTITGPSDAISVLTTWDDAPTAFRGIFLNVTNTASQASSMLLSLNVNATNRFRVTRDGITTQSGTNTVTLGTITGAQAMFTGTADWNNAAVIFYGRTLDITDTASAAESRLDSITLGGISEVFAIAKTGGILVGANTEAYWGFPDNGETLVSMRDTNIGEQDRNEIFIGVHNSLGTNEAYINPFTTLAGGASLELRYNTAGNTTSVIQIQAFNSGVRFELEQAGATWFQAWSTANDFLQVSPVWNDAGIAFNALLVNPTDNASAAGANVINVQVSSAPRFSVRKDGFLTMAGSGGLTLTFNPDTNTITTAATTATTLTAPGLTVASGTITTDINNLLGTVTWNAAGVTFTGWELRVTDTASAAASLLMDLQVGGTSQWNATKAGKVTQLGVLNLPIGAVGAVSVGWNGDANTGIFSSGDGIISFASNGAHYQQFGPQYIAVESSSIIAWTSGAATAAADTVLRRDAANTLAQRNGTTAQIHNIYNTFTTVATSGEWFAIDWAATANVCNLWTRKGSSAGTARNLGLGTDGVQRWSIHATTGLLAAAAGVELQLGNAAVAATPTPTHTLTIRDSTGTLYRIPCVV